MNKKDFFGLVNDRENIFLTGSGGVGKSWNIKELIRQNGAGELPYHYNIALTATTGIAALNIGGQTIHKFSGMGIYNKKTDIFKVTNTENWEKVRGRIQRADIVIIDEISMLRSDSFNFLSFIFQNAMRDEETGEISDLPFGGKQMVFVGDFLQLPPVVKHGEELMGHFAFQTRTWKDMDVKTVHLTEVKRQSDKVFIDALNEVRMGQCSENTAKLFRSRVCKPEDKDIIALTALNKEADEINYKRLTEIEEAEESFINSRAWTEDYTHEKLKKQVISHYFNELESLTEVKVKKGCKVLITANGRDGDYVNGHIGTYQTTGYLLDLRVEKYSVFQDYFNYGEIEGDEGIERLDDYTYLIKDTEDDLHSNPPYYSTYTKLEKWFEFNRLKNMEFSPAFVMVIALDEDRNVYVQRDSKTFFHPDQESFEIPALTLSQFPIKLGWAISMHKSQGQTLKEAYISPENIFSYGQFYVALSRVQSLDGIYLKSFSPRKIMVDPAAISFYRSL